jgi:hypothetical protein
VGHKVARIKTPNRLTIDWMYFGAIPGTHDTLLGDDGFCDDWTNTGTFWRRVCALGRPCTLLPFDSCSYGLLITRSCTAHMHRHDVILPLDKCIRTQFTCLARMRRSKDITQFSAL